MKTNGYLKRILSLTTALILSASVFCGCGSHTYDPLAGVETKQVQDDTGRNVEVPETITKIAPSGAAAQMILLTVAPEMMVGLSASPSTKQFKYFPEDVWYLPTFGQFYGSKSNLNMEALIDAEPQVILDLGDRKLTIKNDMNSIGTQTGIPALFYEATLEKMPNAYRQLGKLLGKEEKCEKEAQFIEKTLAMAAEKSAQIPEDEKLTVLYGTGSTGLAVNAAGSSQAQVIDIVGGKNAVIPDTVTDRGGGTLVNMEELYSNEPDVIIQTAKSLVDTMADSEWSELKAVKEGKYYYIPGEPYCWMSSPPSVNMVLGVWWLGQLLYPDIYNDYDMAEVAQEYYKLFWDYDLSTEEVEAMLADSILKDR